MEQKEILKKCFSFMDLTTLHTEDTPEAVKNLVGKVVALQKEYPDYPLPASVCVYPNLANVVRENRPCEELHVTAVSSCFPTAQSFIEVKVLETRMAIENGADEIDIVLAVNKFMAGDYSGAKEEIAALRTAVDETAAKVGRKVVLKVILETGLLKTPELIRKASMLAMEAGADFIKTSTGKVSVNATPEAARVMCEAIRDFYRETGRKVGFKAAGGIATAEDALVYYNIGLEILGEEWLNKDFFRFGVSRVGNALMSAIEGREVKFF